MKIHLCIDCGLDVSKPGQRSQPKRCPEHRRLAKNAQCHASRERNPEATVESQRRYDAKRNPTPHRKAQQKAGSLKRLYQMSVEEWDRRFAEQNGLCAVCCLRPATDVDHSHTTGQVRGLLCPQCNKALGLLGDSAATAHSATKHLLKNLELP